MTTNHTPPTHPSTAMDVEALRIDHEFKSHPDVFFPAQRGEKTFEFRKDDRGGYHVGQTVRLRCYDGDTGYRDVPPLDRVITNILRPGEFGLQDGYCILILAALTQAPQAATVEREGWQDISTAPKDGSEIILADGHSSWAGFWDNGSECRRADAGFFAEMDRGTLLTAKNTGATHWRPLPAPPGAAAPTAPTAPERGGGDDAQRLYGLKVAWGRHEDLKEPDHSWLLAMASRGIAARLPTPDPGIAARLAEFSDKAPRGVWKVICSEIGDGPDRRPIAFLVDADDEDRIFAVDEEPEALELAAELVNAYRSGALTATPTRPVVDGARDASAGPSPWPEPWKRCPSTHCERAGECRSPHDCMVRKAPSTTPEQALRGAAEALRDVDKDVARQAMANCAEAIKFFDKVKASSKAEQIAVGSDHWNWLESACRRTAAALAAISADPATDGGR